MSEREGKAGGPDDDQGSLLTVVVALVANGLLALAKSFAAAISGSSAMLAEAAHSWADTGNEVFLLMAERRGKRPRDESHPRGYGRATYTWSLVAAFGLFSAGAGVSVWSGVTDLLDPPEEEASFVLNYVVLGIALLLEGTSFLQAAHQVHGRATRFGLHPLRFVTRTSDPTLRAVFLEDSSAIAGILIAGAGIGLHEVTGDPVWDAIASLLIGVLLGSVAVFLMRRNMDYLVGVSVDPSLRDRVLLRLLAHAEVERVTYLHVEYVGPQRVFVVAAVDLVGDDTEDHLATRFRRVEDALETSDVIEDAVLTLAQPGDPALEPLVGEVSPRA